MSDAYEPPAVLDPRRVAEPERDDLTPEELRTREREMRDALNETCAYASKLWHELAADREYLRDSLPPDPRHPDSNRIATSPTGPDDTAGWQAWSDRYASVSAVLNGPQGDNGYGRTLAREEAGLRQSAPNARLRAAHPRLAPIFDTAEPAESAPPQQPPAQPHDAAPHDAAPHDAAPHDAAPEPASRARMLRAAMMGALVVLAIRGIRPRSR